MNINKEVFSKDIFIKKGKCFSWSAVVVGALVGLGISFLLNLFGIAIGLAAFTHAANSTSLTFAMGGFIALIVVSIISMSVLGLVAGYLGALKKLECNAITTPNLHCNYGCLYGFTAWSLALILSIVLAFPAGKFINYSTKVLSNPTLVLTTDLYPKNVGNQTVSTTQSKQITTNPPTTTEEAAKQLALTSFLAFILFFIGAISAALAGHIAFEKCTRKHGEYLHR